MAARDQHIAMAKANHPEYIVCGGAIFDSHEVHIIYIMWFHYFYFCRKEIESIPDDF